MQFKIGLKLWSSNAEIFRKEAVRLYNEGVYDFIELMVIPDTLDTLDKWAELNIPYILHNPHYSQGFDFSNIEKREYNRKIYENTKRFADRLNADKIVFHGGIGGDINETVIQLRELREPRALIENKPLVVRGDKFVGMHCIGARIEEIKFIMDSTGCGFCLDFGHAICAANALGVDYNEFLDELIELEPDMYHLTDLDDITSIYDSHTHLNHGVLDIVNMISKTDNGKCITFETEKSYNDNLSDFEQEIKWLKGNIK